MTEDSINQWVFTHQKRENVDDRKTWETNGKQGWVRKTRQNS